MSAAIHVVSKRDNSQHAVFSIPESSAPVLAPSSVRVRTWMISLTSNNLSYARGGHVLRWWDTYPVPEDAPAGFSDRNEWGIVPAWGYGLVLDSSIDSIKAGSLLWGFWPTSSHAVQMHLSPLEPTGFWRATDAHRTRLMSVYNRYQQVALADMPAMHMSALCKALWMGPYCINRSVFSSDRIHPFGAGDEWTEDDADLTAAVVISLSASSKTGRAFSWELARNRDISTQGPLGLLQLTSAPEALPHLAETELPLHAAKYGDDGAMAWVAKLHPARVVILDFGAPSDILQSVHSAATALCSGKVTYIGVGTEAKMFSPDELKSTMALGASLGKVQLNTSALRDRIVERVGPEFFSQQDTVWDRLYKEKGMGDLQIKVVRAVEGEEGIEGTWSDLCGHKLPPNVGVVVDLSKE